eukprot:c21244_g1_i2.p1 GENE.c21244_g1_i2~~c21244_g1_i2.p1  ORF type:complete len:488 (-),score=161.32 c21244_g1_i2:21-1484(-)
MSVPIVNSVDEFVQYQSNQEKSKQRISFLCNEFEKRFEKAPNFIVRNPGRVNLIGEHIDYMGFSVLPMALEVDCVICIGQSNSKVIRIENSSSEQYPPISLPLGEIQIDLQNHKWYNYALAGIKGVLQQSIANTKLNELNINGFNILVDGTVPKSAGLSSSSALVCASALAVTSILNMNLDKVELSNLCRESEQFVGTVGGGMDQAISFLGMAGIAQRIHFDPLKANPVQLPAGGVFVISNSLVEANKVVSQFNKRVVECRLACAVIAKLLPISEESKAQYNLFKPKLTFRKLLEISELPLNEFKEKSLSLLHKEAYTLNEIAQILSLTTDELTNIFLKVGNRQIEEPFQLFLRASHVLEETTRVELFEKCCQNMELSDDERLKELGKLMNESQFSCSEQYECSCDELDQLTRICRENGALGSRLTGAGWGGCAVSLVPFENVKKFLDSVWDLYYANNIQRSAANRDETLFASTASSGALVWKISSS